MRYADTHVHVYDRPGVIPSLSGNDGALQILLGLIEAAIFVALLWAFGEVLAEVI
jgi:hypothetical protein